VIIVPDQVESLDLSDPEKARRHLYTFVVDEKEEEKGDQGVNEGAKKTKIGEWKEETLWP
jgi:hypothetical protein